MARKAEIILTDDGQFSVLGSETDGGGFKPAMWKLTEKNFGIPTIEQAVEIAGNFLNPNGRAVRVKR